MPLPGTPGVRASGSNPAPYNKLSILSYENQSCPVRTASPSIHVPTRKSAAGRTVTGTSESVAADLRGSGYRVAIREEAKA